MQKYWYVKCNFCNKKFRTYVKPEQTQLNYCTPACFFNISQEEHKRLITPSNEDK